MRPNIFIAQNYCAEDFFSHGLAYVLSLLPDLGDRIADRIAVLSGRGPGYFGSFKICEFVAHEYPLGHEASRPDLRFVCRRRTIYFENKLDAPLSVPQIRRHSRMVRRSANARLVFVSNINHRCPALRMVTGYLHPRGRDHFLWVDLLPALKSRYRKGSHAARVLADFGEALKLHGIVGRTIHGATGSLYSPGSQACRLALDQLSQELRTVGFCVARNPREATLRVYPTRHGKYPLLNPRFYATASWLERSLDFEALVLTVLSRRGDRRLDRALARFPSRRGCVFLADSVPVANVYTCHGDFVLPVRFIGNRSGSRINFSLLTRAFEAIHDSLTSL